MNDILERLKLELNDDEPKSFVEIDSQLIRDLAAEIRQLRLALNHQIEMRRQITGPLRKELEALRSRVGELEEENSSLRFEVSKMRDVLYQLKREYGHYSINAGTSTLGLFVDMVCKDTHFVDERAQQLNDDAAWWAWVRENCSGMFRNAEVGAGLIAVHKFISPTDAAVDAARKG